MSCFEAIFPDLYTPNAEKRGCYDCGNCRGAISWWCKSEAAIKERGTSLPTLGYGCPHWVAARRVSDLTLLERAEATLAGPFSRFIMMRGGR